MRGFNLITLGALATTILAIPTPQTGVNDPSYRWEVTGWSAGCAHSGCYYGKSSYAIRDSVLTSFADFNITGQAYGASPAIPAFSAYCSGGPEGVPYRLCKILDSGPTNRAVAAKLLPAATGTGAHIDVSIQWHDLVTP
jgi:hypothetical protein